MSSRAAQKGFVYEKNTANFLKTHGYVNQDFVPAGSGCDVPDLMISHGKQEAGVELKIAPASAGSLVMKYTSGNHTPWQFGRIKPEEKEKLFISNIADDVGLWNMVDEKWKGVPHKRLPRDAEWKSSTGKLGKKDRYSADLSTFPEINGSVARGGISSYYNTKNTWYINVASHGFYLLGKSDPLGLNARLAQREMSLIPPFEQSASSKYRARVQYKGGGNHQFTFELSFSMSGKSPYNIAPVIEKTVNIDKSVANLDFLM